MMLTKKVLAGTVCIFLLMPFPMDACTSFFLDQDGIRLFGANYDWHLGSGMVIINQRGVSKTGLTFPGTDPVSPPAWVSKFGSITFNQYGREAPTGGMNEAGLAILLMMLSQARYPDVDSRKPVKNSQWIQYMLDNYSRVAEVINSSASIRIQQEEVPGLHYLVADRSGGCASLEWIDGKQVCHTGDAMPVSALTNHTYALSLKYLARHSGFGGTRAFDPVSTLSLDRFARVARMLAGLTGPTQAPDAALAILASVADDTTQWRIVYDMNQLRVYFRTKKHHRVRHIDLRRFDLACGGPVQVIDLDADLSGDVTDRFMPYSLEMNFRLIRKAFRRSWFSRHLPDTVIRERSRYPETFSCVD